MNNEYPSACDFIAETDHLKKFFESRFKECDDMKLCLRFVRDKISFDPDEFTCNNSFVDDVAAAQTELLEFKSNFEIRDYYDKLSLDLFWKKIDNWSEVSGVSSALSAIFHITSSIW